MDLSTQAGVDMSDSYDTSSPFWQALMAHRETIPAYFYPRYPMERDFDEAHDRRIQSMNVVHEVNRVTYRRQRDAAGPSQAGSSHVQFPGNLPRFDDEHARPEED
ncbi:hypothetical protein A2U01_0052932 [Trifolium medium]|uniref:Uncharacterized protein n=1 Tax=Trifolium medium TaxID=97028 RepID=A0A392R7G2_9FABA|nr:hypothetical protein [Trifolium medium]